MKQYKYTKNNKAHIYKQNKKSREWLSCKSNLHTFSEIDRLSAVVNFVAHPQVFDKVVLALNSYID